MSYARAVPGSVALLATLMVASAAFSASTADDQQVVRLASGADPRFSGHPFRVLAPCMGGGSLNLRIRPVVSDQGEELLTATFVLRGADPGSHWTWGAEAVGGGSGEAEDGEFTVPDDGGAVTITKLGRAAHSKQTMRLIATEDQGSVPTEGGSSCRLKAVARY
jgi:hypothetical protein